MTVLWNRRSDELGKAHSLERPLWKLDIMQRYAGFGSARQDIGVYLSLFFTQPDSVFGTALGQLLHQLT